MKAMNSMRIVSVRNSYDVKVKRCCASCQHKCIKNDGTRFCALKMMMVEQKFKCKQWQMSDGMKNAGKGGGVVRLKAAIKREQSQACLGYSEREQARRDNVKGTTEVIIK